MADFSTYAVLAAVMVAPFGLTMVLGRIARRSETFRRALGDYPYTGRMVTTFFGDGSEGSAARR